MAATADAVMIQVPIDLYRRLVYLAGISEGGYWHDNIKPLPSDERGDASMCGITDDDVNVLMMAERLLRDVEADA